MFRSFCCVQYCISVLLFINISLQVVIGNFKEIVADAVISPLIELHYSTNSLYYALAGMLGTVVLVVIIIVTISLRKRGKCGKRLARVVSNLSGSADHSHNEQIPTFEFQNLLRIENEESQTVPNSNKTLAYVTNLDLCMQHYFLVSFLFRL